MPSLITVRNPATSQEERIEPSVTHDNSIASFTDINKLLDGVSFNESLSELDAPSSELMPASYSLASTSFNVSRTESFVEAKGTSPHSKPPVEDPDITTLEDDVVQGDKESHPNDEGTRTLCDKENALLSQPETAAPTVQPKGVSMDSKDCNTTVPVKSTTHQKDPSSSKHDLEQKESLSRLHSTENHALGRNREVFRHERRFKERFEQQVSTCIAAFKQERPGVIVDYRSLSNESKGAAIQHSEKLLQRIRDYKSGNANFAKLACRSESQQRTNTTGLASFSESQRSVKHSIMLSQGNLLSPVANDVEVSLLANDTGVSLATNHVEGVDTTVECEDANTSAALLSPFEQTPSSRDKARAKKYLEGMDEIEDLEDGSLSEDISKAYRSPPKSRHQAGNISPCTETTSYRRHGVESPKADAPSPNVTKDALNMSNYSDMDFDNANNSVDSIECVRNEKKISNSPMMLATPLSTNRIHQKRGASRSGKRGAETSRFKQSEESFVSIDPNDHLFSDKGSPICSLHSGDSSSPRPGILFTASQSPILQDPKALQTGDRVDTDSDRDLNDSICTTESNNQRRVRWNLSSDDSHLLEIPANVALGEKAHFKMQPLQVRKSNSGNSAEGDRGSFPDPFEKYRTVERRKLKGVYDWIVSRDDSADNSIAKQMGGILFSMALRQTIDCAVRLILDSNGKTVEKPQLQDGCLQGATLVICRTKEDTEQFASALRDGTGASVLNHASLQSTDRTGSRTAAKCATFDVVLSTFDAIISKDVAITLDYKGHVVRKEERQDGWLSSRSSSHNEDSPLRLEKLSVLHMLDWERIIFVDILGRGCYTAKYGTFRSKAATALNSASRFVFFTPSQATKKQWEALSKSDRRSFQAVSNVLRLPDAGGDESSIFRNSIDLKNARKAGR